MSMKERNRLKFQERAAKQAAERAERERNQRRVQRYDALQRNARDVYEYDRDFVGDFSDER